MSGGAVSSLEDNMTRYFYLRRMCDYSPRNAYLEVLAWAFIDRAEYKRRLERLARFLNKRGL